LSAYDQFYSHFCFLGTRSCITICKTISQFNLQDLKQNRNIPLPARIGALLHTKNQTRHAFIVPNWSDLDRFYNVDIGF